MEYILRKHWSLKKYRGKEKSQQREEEAGSDVTKLDKALKSELFWCMVRVIHETGHLAEGIGRWCEGCPCHNYKLMAGVNIQCQLKSCRAPELASGEASEAFERRFANSYNKILAFTSGLSSKSRHAVLQDWDKSRGRVMTELTLKLCHWTQLPHALCALAHWCPEKSMKAAQHVLQLWDEQPGKSHHPMSRRFLDKDWTGLKQDECPLRPYVS